MTLPSLINKTHEKEYKTAFKKQYSTFAQAMQRAYIEEGTAYSSVNWKQMPKYLCRIQKEMKVIKSGLICPDNVDNMSYQNGSGAGGTEFGGDINEWPLTGKTYWHENYSWFDKKGIPQMLNNLYHPLSFLLPDGALVVYNCTKEVFVDVNGYKKPNTIGVDIFYFILNDNKTFPEFFAPNGQVQPNACSITGSNSTPNLTRENYEEDCKNGSGWGCSPQYILN